MGDVGVGYGQETPCHCSVGDLQCLLERSSVGAHLCGIILLFAVTVALWDLPDRKCGCR